jgi:aspartate aminotransferase
MQVVSNRVRAAADSFEPFRQFYFRSRYADRRGDPDICDFTFGNPHEMPLPGIVDAIRHHAVPHNKDWFAYKTSEPEPQAFLVERLSQSYHCHSSLPTSR